MASPSSALTRSSGPSQLAFPSGNTTSMSIKSSISGSVTHKPILKKTSGSTSASATTATLPLARTNDPGGPGAGVGVGDSCRRDEIDIKKVRKVRFNPYVNRVRLPLDEYEEAQKARKSRIKEAPYHDELWDGDAYAFREKELTMDELWALRIRSKVSSLPRRLSKPIKRGLKALQYLLPGKQPVDLVGAHAHKIKEDDTRTTVSSGGNDSNSASFLKVPILRRQSSLPRGHELSIEIGEISASTFDRYDELLKLINAFKNVPDELAKAERCLAGSRKDLQQAKERLRDLRFELPELERRLAKNANPRLLHYMQFSRDEKVRRLENEYDTLKRQRDEEQRNVEKLAMTIFEGNEKLDKLGNQLVALRGAEAEKVALEMYVSQEYGADDQILNSIMDAVDEHKFKLDKEISLEKKLRDAARQFQVQVIEEFLFKAEQALKEADSMIIVTHNDSGQASSSSSRPLSSSQRSYPSLLAAAPKPVTSLSQRTYPSLLAKQQQQSPMSSQDTSTLVKRRRDMLATARENVFKAVDMMDRILDEIEDLCKDKWSTHILEWRKEIPALGLEDVFANSAALLRKRTTSDGFDRLSTPPSKKAGEKAANAADPSLIQQLKKRVERKLETVRKLSALAQRYIEFFNREASRAVNRTIQLSEKKKELQNELANRRKIVFELARRQVMQRAGRNVVDVRDDEIQAGLSPNKEDEQTSRPESPTSMSLSPPPVLTTGDVSPELPAAFPPANKVMMDEDHRRRLSSDPSTGDEDGDTRLLTQEEEDAAETMSVTFPTDTGSPDTSMSMTLS